jgi:archaellum biogenesis ATPase FlaH
MLEKQILTKLVHDEDFLRKTIPFLRDEYFNDRNERQLFKLIVDYVKKYNSTPAIPALSIEIENLTGINDDDYKTLSQYVTDLKDTDVDKQWLLDQTEKFCQDRAIYNAIMSSIQILDGRDQKNDKGNIPTILSEALSVSFDSHVGHDFLEDYLQRYDFYHKKEERIPFDLEYFNRITKGGLPNKTLNIALAGTGVGKSLFMCHCAASNLSAGHNVLYITLEMSEEKIAERIDANLLNVQVDELSVLPKDAYEKKIKRVMDKTTGRLVIKEYPTASAGANHFRHLLNELNLKRNFIPDIIYVDYLNICISSRLKYGSNVNSYTYVKSIAEELRGLAVEYNLPIVSATQTTRSGYSNTDVGLEDTSESFGLPATADLMFALISSEELEDLGQIMVKQLKNRYNDPSSYRKFVVGVDRAKMKLYNVEQVAQEDIADDKPAFDKSESGKRINLEKKFNKDVFADFS